MVEVKLKRQKVSDQPNANRPQPALPSSGHVSSDPKFEDDSRKEQASSTPKQVEGEAEAKVDNPVKSLLGLSYASSDDEDD